MVNALRRAMSGHWLTAIAMAPIWLAIMVVRAVHRPTSTRMLRYFAPTERMRAMELEEFERFCKEDLNNA